MGIKRLQAYRMLIIGLMITISLSPNSFLCKMQALICGGQLFFTLELYSISYDSR